MKVYEIYIDNLFLMNFVMNLYLYLLTATTLRRTATRLRITAGSFIQSLLFCVLVLMPGIPAGIKRFIGPAAVSMASTAVIFKCRKPDEWLHLMGYQLIYAFVLGGCMKFLFSSVPLFRDRQESIWYILGAGFFGYQAVSWWIGQMKRKKAGRFCTVRLCGNGVSVSVRALIDTGNSLREPISGRPVSIVEDGILDCLVGVKAPEKLKLIPYHSIGKEHGMMEGYEIPEILIEEDGKKIRWQKVIAGISRNRISAEGKYQMILHPELTESEDWEESK